MRTLRYRRYRFLYNLLLIVGVAAAIVVIVFAAQYLINKGFNYYLMFGFAVYFTMKASIWINEKSFDYAWNKDYNKFIIDGAMERFRAAGDDE